LFKNPIAPNVKAIKERLCDKKWNKFKLDSQFDLIYLIIVPF